MQLSLGASSLGTAMAATQAGSRRGLALAGAGGVLGALIRPHVAAVAATSATVGLTAARRSRAAMTMAGQAAALALIARHDLGRYGFTGAGATVSHAAVRTRAGGSAFDPRESARPAAMLGVLFRPHPLEAHNTPAAVAALEGVLLLALTLRDARRGKGPGTPACAYTAYALACTLLLTVAFSGIANHGLLSRQRAQLLPFYLVLIAGRRS
jgi:hypothetical protein